MRHFLTLLDYTKDEIIDILNIAIKIKNEHKNQINKNYLSKKILGMIFEKNSTRTRVSFEAGIYQLGGIGIFLSANDIQLNRGESIADTSRVISSMLDMIMIRTSEHSRLEEFAKYSQVPIINGLTDKYHPIQLMADYLTIIESNLEKDLIVSYIGDGNNMANSWAILASIMGFELRIATPVGYEVDQNVLIKVKNNSKKSGAKILISNDPKSAIKDSTVVTTDTWISMGQEKEKLKRIKDFKEYTINTNMMKLASPKAIFLHCLPAYKGYEVTNDVFESNQSLVFQEANNRLHIQKGIMVWLNQQNKNMSNSII
jgi:ornithine carbamoyltransferase